MQVVENVLCQFGRTLKMRRIFIGFTKYFSVLLFVQLVLKLNDQEIEEDPEFLKLLLDKGYFKNALSQFKSQIYILPSFSKY